MSTDIELNEVNIDPNSSNVDVNKSDSCVNTVNNESIVEGYKKEYSIVGDGLYASVNTDESPQWLNSIIDSVVDTRLSPSFSNLSELQNSLNEAIQEIEAAKNTYNEDINIIANAEGIIASHLATLNATLTDNINSTINALETTYVTPNEAAAIVAQETNARFENAEADIISANIARATGDDVLTTKYDTLNAVIEDPTTGLYALSNATQSLSTYVGFVDGSETGTGLLADVEILQKQNDGVIETYTGTYDVILNADQAPTDDDELVTTAEPYASWIAADTASDTQEQRSIHIGDVYIKYQDNGTGGKEYLGAYKFIKTIPDQTSPHSTDDEGYTWALISDTDAQNAYIAALNAYDLADGKRRVFTTTPVAPYDVGDLWVRDVSSSSQVWVANVASTTSYNVSHWSVASTDDKAVTTLSTGLANGTVSIDLSSATIDGTTALTTYVGDEIDKQVVVYSGTSVTDQTGMKTNDLYIEKTTATGDSGIEVDVVNTYRYDGTDWVQISNNSNITALADLADGKRSVYAGSTTPEDQGYTPEERDIWIPEADLIGTGTVDEPQYTKGEVYQYKNNAWILATKYTENLDNFVDNVYQPTVTTLKNQVDGKIEYYYYDNPTNNPLVNISVGWGEAEHGNVVYYKDTDQGYWYNSSLDTFEQLTDTSMLKALQQAEDAQATADGVVVSYYALQQDSAPATNKLWINLTGTQVLKKYTGSWVAVDVKEGDTLTAYNPVTKDLSIYVYNGTQWITETAGGVVAESKAVTDLTVDLEALDTSIYGATGLEQTLRGEITDEGARVESKFAYNSVLNLNGTYYNSGFGIDSVGTSGAGTIGDPFDSTFWINAEKFKFTNNNQTGVAAPFSIDASGATPQVTFNGVVNFSNVSGVPTIPTSTSQLTNDSSYATTSYVSTAIGNAPYTTNQDVLNAIANDTTTIDGSRITTGTIDAARIDTNAIVIGSRYSDGLYLNKDAIRVISNGVVRVQLGDLTV
jgi:hypothetical protein